MNTTITKRSEPSINSGPVPSSSRRLAVGLMAVASVVSVLIRLIPYGVRPPNVNANGSMGLFGGARVPVWLALPLQILSLVVSDLILLRMFGWEPFNPYVYGSFVAYLLMGRAMLKGNDSVSRIAAVSFLASVQFFIITNFGVWMSSARSVHPLYEANVGGLLQCYTAALPYFAFTVAGDVGFSAVFFGAQAWLYGMLFAAKPVKGTEEVAG